MSISDSRSNAQDELKQKTHILHVYSRDPDIGLP
jgi:hypothetical protein